MKGAPLVPGYPNHITWEWRGRRCEDLQVGSGQVGLGASIIRSGQVRSGMSILVRSG